MDNDKLMLQKRLIAKLTVVTAICLVICALIVISIYQYQSSIQDDLDKIKKETSSINGEIQKIENSQKSIRDAYDNFKNIRRNRIPTENTYNSSVARQITAKDILTELSQKYQFITLLPRLTPPKIKGSDNRRRRNQRNNELLATIESKMEIRFEAMSDELVYGFIEDAQKHFPGYLKLINLNINRRNDINADVLLKMKETNRPLALVTGSLEFVWYTVAMREDLEES